MPVVLEKCPQGNMAAIPEKHEIETKPAKKKVEERIKAMKKELFWANMCEEGTVFLKEHPTKANGYGNHDLLTSLALWKVCVSPA
ncbi:MAG: hypothetical protein ACK42E_03140, partial [Candidatus Bipolaricaulaceae bacterium]